MTPFKPHAIEKDEGYFGSEHLSKYTNPPPPEPIILPSTPSPPKTPDAHSRKRKVRTPNDESPTVQYTKRKKTSRKYLPTTPSKHVTVLKTPHAPAKVSRVTKPHRATGAVKKNLLQDFREVRKGSGNASSTASIRKPASTSPIVRTDEDVKIESESKDSSVKQRGSESTFVITAESDIATTLDEALQEDVVGQKIQRTRRSEKEQMLRLCRKRLNGPQ